MTEYVMTEYSWIIGIKMKIINSKNETELETLKHIEGKGERKKERKILKKRKKKRKHIKKWKKEMKNWRRKGKMKARKGRKYTNKWKKWEKN